MSRIMDRTVTADGNETIDWHASRIESGNEATVWVFGGGGNNFGGGTVTLKGSPDGGTTFVDLKNSAGAVITFTANGAINYTINTSRNPKPAEIIKIRLTLAGSTAPTVRYTIDNAS